MKYWKRILGIILIVLGLGSVGMSLYITQQVQQGNLKIAKAEKTISSGNKFLSLTPATRELGQGLAQSAQKKIDEGKDQIAYYEQMASQLKIAGIVVAILGVGLCLLPVKKPKR